MQFNGTKGEWKIGNHFSNIVTSEKPLRLSYSDKDYDSEREYYGGYIVCESVSCKADANLIAAAPDLLEACLGAIRIKELWANSSEGSNASNQGEFEALNKMEGMISNAIQKALGHEI